VFVQRRPHWTSRIVLFVGVSLAAGTSAGSAAAQTTAPTNPPKEEERTALYREGVLLAEGGRWSDALQKFEKVVAIRSAPPALVALATAQEKVGKLASAKRTYVDARAQARALGDAALVAKADKALTAIESRIARIIVVLPPDALGAEVRIDGGAASGDSGGTEVDPGEHEIMVTASGRPTFQQRFVMSPEQRKEVAVQFGSAGGTVPAAKTSAPATSYGDDARAGPPLGSWVLGSAGVAASIAGSVMLLVGNARYGDVSDQCPNGRCATVGDVDEGNDGRIQMLAGYWVGGAGLACLAGAGLWWALTPSKSGGTQVATRPISIAPTPLYGGAAMIVRGDL
jgi:hypothetical protein